MSPADDQLERLPARARLWQPRRVSGEAPERPETRGAYFCRKREELALLHAALREPPPPSLATIDSVAALWAAKQALRGRLIARAAECAALLGETNFGELTRPHPPGALVFDYQRYNLLWRQDVFAEFAYPLPPRLSGYSVGLVVSSGMAAISAALRALDEMARPGQRLLLPDDAYFETARLAARYLNRLAPESTRGIPRADGDAIIYLDSISARLSALDFHGRPAAVLFDTTCHDAASLHIARVVDRCLAAAVPCVLLRSHIKLDQLGVEYWRLGSLVILSPGGAPPAHWRFVKELRSRASDAVGAYGSNFVPIALFPPALDAELAPRLRELNRRRNRRIAWNNRFAARRLRRLVGSAVRGYHHGCFLHLAGAAPQRARAIADALVARGVEARVLPSFGHDLVGVLAIEARAGEEGREGVRVALSDMPYDDLELAVQTLAEVAP